MLLQSTLTVSPGQALTAKLGQTPLKSRTKGRGPLRLGTTWRPPSTPTPNRFHGHAPFNLAGPTSQQHGRCGRTRGKAGRSAGRSAEPTRAAASPARPSCRTPQVRRPNPGPGPHRPPVATPRYNKGRRAAPRRSKRQRRVESSLLGRRTGSRWAVKGRGSAMAARRGGCLATGPAAAAPALRPGRQRGAAPRRGSAAAARGLRTLPVKTCSGQMVFARRKASPACFSRT